MSGCSVAYERSASTLCRTNARNMHTPSRKKSRDLRDLPPLETTPQDIAHNGFSGVGVTTIISNI